MQLTCLSEYICSGSMTANVPASHGGIPDALVNTCILTAEGRRYVVTTGACTLCVVLKTCHFVLVSQAI